MLKRSAFTIIEVLIAIALLGIILPSLYQGVILLQESNTHLFKHLKKVKKVTQATNTLYLDLVSSDGNLSIKKDEFARVCIESTKNSLYGLSEAKVCWVVLKEKNTLVRVEGIHYDLPISLEDRVEVDAVIENIELFDIYHKKDKILVFLKQKSKDVNTFMIYGVEKFKPKKPNKKKKKKSNKQNLSSPVIPNVK